MVLLDLFFTSGGLFTQPLERLCDKSGKKLTSCGRSGSKDEKGCFLLLRGCSYLKGEAKDLDTSSAELGRSPARRGAKHSREWLLAHCCDQVLDPDQVASSL